jgi:hypothetical protein
MLELYRIKDEGFECLYWAHDEQNALDKYNYNRFGHNPIATKILTDQGYPVIRLRDVPAGSYFHRVTRKDGEYCEHSVVWCKGEYDRSTKKWFCHKFEDVNHSKLYKGEEMVTIDFTF